QALTAAGAGLLFLIFGLLPRYIIAVFQVQSFGATERLLAMGLAVGAVVLIPAIGMGMTFPLLTDLVTERHAAGGSEVGRAYAINTAGSIVGAVLTGFVLVVTLGTDLTLRAGLLVNVVAALALAGLAARGVAEGSAEHRRLGARVLGAGALASLALVVALAAPRWSTRLIDLGPSIYARGVMDARAVTEFLAHRGSRQLAYAEGWNATALARPNLSVIVDDARSALQIDPTRYDVVVSEPSNPWLAGVATLYTPEFFRVVRSRLADDGVFCQWVQLYQLPLPVVAGVV